MKTKLCSDGFDIIGLIITQKITTPHNIFQWVRITEMY